MLGFFGTGFFGLGDDGRVRLLRPTAWMAVLSTAVAVLGGCSDAETGVGGPTPTPGTTGTDTGGEESSGSSESTGMAEGTGDGDESSTGAPMGSIECGEIPLGAVDAEFEHTPSVEDLPGSFDWMMMGLPEGLAVNPLTGQISGRPALAGSYDVEVIATGGSPEQMLQATCTLEIAEGLEVDLSALDGPCYGPDDDLLEVFSGGDGSGPTCSTPGGQGNGTPPQGVSVDPETCAITGEPDDTFGIWTWITVVEQSGKRVFVPSCIVESDTPEGSYDISASHGDILGGDSLGVLEPGAGTFVPGETISFGTDGDPRFEIRGPCSADGCFFGFAYRVSASPFDAFELSPSARLDDMDTPVGFYHGMSAQGPAVEAAFEDRPFVLNWDIDYCIALEGGTCDGVDNIRANGNGSVRFGVIMRPEPAR